MEDLRKRKSIKGKPPHQLPKTPYRMFYVYLLKSKKDGKLYIGFTNDLVTRLEKHNRGEVFSTKGRVPLELIYCEGYKSLQDARKRERNLKLFSRAYYALRRRLSGSL